MLQDVTALIQTGAAVTNITKDFGCPIQTFGQYCDLSQASARTLKLTFSLYTKSLANFDLKKIRFPGNILTLSGPGGQRPL